MSNLRADMQVIGPFTVNWDDPDVLTTGVELWTPEAGHLIYNMWFEVATDFAGSGGWAISSIQLQTANDVLWTADQGDRFYVAAGYEDDGIDVAELYVSDVLSVTGNGVGYPGEHYFPARMKVTTPIRLKLVPNAGAMTAGVLQVYAMVGELA